MPCSLFTCFPGNDCHKHPRPPPQMIFLMGSCSLLISVEIPLSYSQCLHLQLCHPPDGAKLIGIFFPFTEGAQMDGNFLRYFIHCGSQTMLWKVAWTFSKLSFPCEPWTSWLLHFCISGIGIASSIYALLLRSKEQDDWEMRPELSMQTYIFASICCSLVLHNMSTCSFLLWYTWSIALMKCLTALFIQPCPVWEVYFYGHKLQPYTQFGSITWALQKKYMTDGYTGRVAVPQMLSV